MLVWTLDPSLGRIDKSTLSQQTLMELFIENITNKEDVCGSTVNPKDVSKWTDVVCNDTDEITEIRWSHHDINGSIDLQWLPPTLQKVSISNHLFSNGWLNGTIDLTALPYPLKHLDLSGNYMTGTISLTSLPPQMKVLSLYGNELEGTLDLTNLPWTLETLDLSWNRFEGKPDFSKLPESLRELGLEDNKLEGTIYVDTKRIKCSVQDTDIVLKHKI